MFFFFFLGGVVVRFGEYVYIYIYIQYAVGGWLRYAPLYLFIYCTYVHIRLG